MVQSKGGQYNIGWNRTLDNDDDEQIAWIAEQDAIIIISLYLRKGITVNQAK